MKTVMDVPIFTDSGLSPAPWERIRRDIRRNTPATYRRETYCRDRNRFHREVDRQALRIGRNSREASRTCHPSRTSPDKRMFRKFLPDHSRACHTAYKSAYRIAASFASRIVPKRHILSVPGGSVQPVQARIRNLDICSTNRSPSIIIIYTN